MKCPKMMVKESILTIKKMMRDFLLSLSEGGQMGSKIASFFTKERMTRIVETRITSGDLQNIQLLAGISCSG
jgi:hypothetical protein